jgi:glycine cleavage system aminomethyltransferase T
MNMCNEQSGHSNNTARRLKRLAYKFLTAAADSTNPRLAIPGGSRSLETLRLENGSRVCGSDLSPQISPLEAGLGFCCKFGKAGGFIGEEALMRMKHAGGPQRQLVCFTLAIEADLSNAALGFVDAASNTRLHLRPGDLLTLIGNEAVL